MKKHVEIEQDPDMLNDYDFSRCWSRLRVAALTRYLKIARRLPIKTTEAGRGTLL
jgi:hypothetical protein